MVDAPDAVGHPDAVLKLRAAFQATGYTQDGIRVAIGIDLTNPESPQDAEVYIRRMGEPVPLHTLIKLFVLGRPVTPAEAGEALAPLGLAEAVEAGVVLAEGDEVRRAVSISAVQDMWFAHDPYVEDQTTMRQDHVIGPGPASRTLAAFTVRPQGGSFLDVGTGCGIQSLLAAGHADTIVATDINPRALACTQFNALLNGVDRVEVRRGSFFEPVRDETFDVVVSNPPFVISPDSRFEYRDSELPGDAVSREVVRGAVEHLAPGGFATVLCNWIVAEGEEWADPPSRWVQGLGCDAWISHSDTEDPLSYAAMWLGSGTGPAYGAELDRWLDYHRSLGAKRLVTGLVVLRPAENGDGWVRTDHVPGLRSFNASDHILRIFRNQDYLAAVRSDREILDGRFRLVPEHRVEQVLAPREGTYEVQEMRLRFDRGFAFEGKIDEYALGVVSGCDGRRRLGDLVGKAAATMKVEVAELAPVAVAVARQLVSFGFLEAPEDLSPAPGPRGYR